MMAYHLKGPAHPGVIVTHEAHSFTGETGSILLIAYPTCTVPTELHANRPGKNRRYWYPNTHWATERFIGRSSEPQISDSEIRIVSCQSVRPCRPTNRSPLVQAGMVIGSPALSMDYPLILPLTTAMDKYGMYSDNGIIQTCPLRLQISCFTCSGTCSWQLWPLKVIAQLCRAIWLSEGWIYLTFLTLMIWCDILTWNVLARPGRRPDGIFHETSFPAQKHLFTT